MDFEFLKYQGDQLFCIVVSVFLEITTAALTICMCLGPHKVPSSGCRRGFSNNIMMRLFKLRILFRHLEPFAKPLYKFAHTHIQTIHTMHCLQKLKISFWTSALAILPTCIFLTLSLILNRTKHLLVYKIRKTD